MRRGSACAALLAAAALALMSSSAGAVTFGPPSYTGVWGDPFAIATPDLNGDGHPDLVAGISGEVSSVVVTLLGNGRGGFEREQQYALEGAAVFGLTVADLDGDGRPDVAATVSGGVGKRIAVLRGEAGGFLKKTPTYFEVGEGPQPVAAGRFFGHALPDLVVGNAGSNNLSLLENESVPGTVSFAAAKTVPLAHTPSSFAVADFNHDGIPDVVVAEDSERGFESGFTLFEGTGTASGLKVVGFTKLGFNLQGVATGDFNGDGYPDLAFVDYQGGLLPKAAVYVLMNNKHGGFEAPVAYDAFGRPLSIATAEIGGRVDLLVGETGKLLETGHVLLMTNNGSGTFTEAARFPSEEGWGPLLGTDLIGNGAADILEGDQNGTVATLLDLGQASPSPSSLSFGTVTTGQESAPQSVTVTNTGAAPTTVEGLGLSGAAPGEFDIGNAALALGAGTCAGASLAPGASCTGTVAFRPTTAGALAATLLVFSEGNPTPASVALSGVGVAPPPPPPPAPTISAVHESASTWREGGKLAKISRHTKPPPVGTTFSFTLSEAASVTLSFTEQTGGRQVGNKCVAQSRQNSHKRACKRTVTVGTIAFAGHTGTNRVVFQGRISPKKKLSPGRYTLVIGAVNSVNEEARAQSISFTVAK